MLCVNWFVHEKGIMSFESKPLLKIWPYSGDRKSNGHRYLTTLVLGFPKLPK